MMPLANNQNRLHSAWKQTGDVMQLDLDFIRAQFPAFSEPAFAGQSFFENAGGSFTCREVIDRRVLL